MVNPRGNCMVNPKPVHMELPRHHLKENSACSRICVDIFLRRCALSWGKSLCLAAEWVCDTVHLGLPPDCTGGCWAADLCHSAHLKHTSQLQWHSSGFLYCTYQCAQRDLRTTGSYGSKASLIHHVCRRFSIILYGLYYRHITALPDCYLLHGLAKQSQKFCRFNKIADNVSWASVTLGIRCTKKCYVIFNLLQVTTAWDSNI